MNNYVQTVCKFNSELTKLNVEFNMEQLYDGYKWTFPNYPDGDVVLHYFSYGHECGMIESYGFPWDVEDVTCMTPREMALCIANVANQLTMWE